MQGSNDLEIDLTSGIGKAKNGSNVYVLPETYSDIELIEKIFGLDGKSVHYIDMNDLRPIIMNYGEKEELAKKAKKYDKAIIICPHGNTSRVFAEALLDIGVESYSLKGGISALKKR